MSTPWKIAIAAAVAVLALAVAGVAVFAQTPNPPAASGTPQPFGAQASQTFWQTLASKLGVSVPALQQDVRDALKAVVAQALKDGQITQSQADQANSRIDGMPLDRAPFGPFFGERGKGFGFGHGGFEWGSDILNAAAQKLGMTTQALTDELRSGKTLADVAKEKNVNADDLKAAIVSAINAKIDRAVKNGQLTQTQADNLKSKVDGQIDLSKSFIGKGFQGKGFFGGRGNRPFGPQGGATPQPSPAAPQGGTSF